jgi:hypothetical protein
MLHHEGQLMRKLLILSLLLIPGVARADDGGFLIMIQSDLEDQNQQIKNQTEVLKDIDETLKKILQQLTKGQSQ